MKYLNEWTYTVCITLIFSVIFSLLLPKGANGKVGKIIITVFIMISFIAPIKANGLNFNFDNINSISEKQEENEEESYGAIIKSNIEKTLSDAGYKNSKAKLKVKINDNELYIKSAEIYILNDYDKSEVKKYIFDKLGINAQVYYIGE